MRTGLPVGWLANCPPGCLVGWLAGWLAAWLPGCLAAGWRACLLACLLACSLACLRACPLAGSLAGWLAANSWLAGVGQRRFRMSSARRWPGKLSSNALPMTRNIPWTMRLSRPGTLLQDVFAIGGALSDDTLGTANCDPALRACGCHGSSGMAPWQNQERPQMAQWRSLGTLPKTVLAMASDFPNCALAITRHVSESRLHCGN